ncbi:MAG: glucose-6-phosphate dehydrogenase assembly protein OpcA [Cyanobacteria bacterium P01_H01_bin.15]
MMITSMPLVSLQEPKDVSIDDIEAELEQVWQMQSGEDGATATRATTFSIIIYEPDETQPLLSALGFYTGPVDGIAGSRTQAAVTAAQKAYGFQESGMMTPAFEQRLRQEYQNAKEAGNISETARAVVQQYSPDVGGSIVADAIAASNPCRIITLCPIQGEDEGVTAQVSAYCPIQKKSKTSNLVCCEYITLRGTSAALERIGGVVAALTVSGLPKYVWWKACPEPDYGLFKRLNQFCDSFIFDSSTFNQPQNHLVQLSSLIAQGASVADLNWGRLSAWQELTAEAFDPPSRRSGLLEIDQVTLDYEKGNPAQAFMYLGWIASRLQWKPIGYKYEGGDYDIRRVKFLSSEQREISAELAAIPTADFGSILGDLISLRLSSTNLQADCCTVLCSETTGCMRMEAGGGAQACSIRQVSPLQDQATDQLLGRQLQRGGMDSLYEESMAVTHHILQLAD